MPLSSWKVRESGGQAEGPPHSACYKTGNFCGPQGQSARSKSQDSIHLTVCISYYRSVREKHSVCAGEVNVEKWEGLGSIKLIDRKVPY